MEDSYMIPPLHLRDKTTITVVVAGRQTGKSQRAVGLLDPDYIRPNEVMIVQPTMPMKRAFTGKLFHADRYQYRDNVVVMQPGNRPMPPQMLGWHPYLIIVDEAQMYHRTQLEALYQLRALTRGVLYLFGTPDDRDCFVRVADGPRKGKLENIFTPFYAAARLAQAMTGHPVQDRVFHHPFGVLRDRDTVRHIHAPYTGQLRLRPGDIAPWHFARMFRAEFAEFYDPSYRSSVLNWSDDMRARAYAYDSYMHQSAQEMEQLRKVLDAATADIKLKLFNTERNHDGQ